MGPTFPHPRFEGHALLDSGAGEKLERFGDVVLRRPDPQALWRRRLGEDRWAAADLAFVRESDRGGRWEAGPRAAPNLRGPEPQWSCRFDDATFLLRPTPFKHVGVFPEQAANWRFVQRAGELLRGERPRLLNLFGYTGVASVVALQAGFEVTHVDASKTAIAWAKDNLECSGLERDAMRVLCDDALAFALREGRRGSRYQGVLLDPPHHGRGPRGETWQFETGIAPLIEALEALLDERSFLVLSTYAIGFSPLALENLLSGLAGEVLAAELALPEDPEAAGNDAERRSLPLPAGFCARFQRGLPDLALDS